MKIFRTQCWILCSAKMLAPKLQILQYIVYNAWTIYQLLISHNFLFFGNSKWDAKQYQYKTGQDGAMIIVYWQLMMQININVKVGALCKCGFWSQISLLKVGNLVCGIAMLCFELLSRPSHAPVLLSTRLCSGMWRDISQEQAILPVNIHHMMDKKIRITVLHTGVSQS